MLAVVRRSQVQRRLAAALSSGKEGHGTQSGRVGGARVEPEQHWLDRRLPGAREWLEAKNRAWWIKGIEWRCRQHPSLQGRGALVKGLVESRFQELLEKHGHLVTDNRSKTHLQVACLVLATYNTLQPLLRDDQVLRDLLREHLGAKAAPWLRWPLRFGLLLSSDSFAATARRLRWLALDLGRSFACEYSEDQPGRVALQIRSCLYNSLFESEGVSLAECCCCSQDSFWFEGLEWHGVGFQRTSWLGAGGDCCSLAVHRLHKA